MANIDWGVVATVIVVLKGLWDIYKERHKPQVDLSVLDANIAEAANVSVKSLLEAIAHLQKRLEQVESSDRLARNDLQTMGQSMGRLRADRVNYLQLMEDLIKLAGNLLNELETLGCSVDKHRLVYDQLKIKVSKMKDDASQPL